MTRTDDQSAAAAVKALDAPLLSPPATTAPALRFAGSVGAAGGSGADSFNGLTSFQDLQQDGEFDIKQLEKEVIQLKSSVKLLRSQSRKLDQQKLDLSYEFDQLKPRIDSIKFSDNVEKLIKLQEQLKDLEGQKSGFPPKLLTCETDISYLEVGKSVDLDQSLVDSSTKLNALKRELATKMRAILSLRRELDDIPVQTELIQYERGFSDLYAQIQEKHHLTRNYYATYNALLEIKELMLKEASILNSIDTQFKGAMATLVGRSNFLESMEAIVQGTKHKLEKAKLGLLAEQKICESLKEKHTIAIAEQRQISFLLKAFQDECTKYEKLQQLDST